VGWYYSWCYWFDTNIIPSTNDVFWFLNGNISRWCGCILPLQCTCWNCMFFWLSMIVTLLSFVKCAKKFLLCLFTNMGLGASSAWVVIGRILAWIGVQFPLKYLFGVGMSICSCTMHINVKWTQAITWCM
jgi:hypothetical protein